MPTPRYDWPLGAMEVGYLTEGQVAQRLTEVPETSITLPCGTRICWAAVSQRGYYPGALDKANQDSFVAIADVGGQKDAHWFGVYDGHGKTGDKCSQFAREHLPAQFVAAAGPAGRLPEDCATVHAAMAHAHERTNEMLGASKEIDDTLSGTTATSVYLEGGVDRGRIVVANVGDSRTIIASVPASHHNLIDTTVGLKVTALSSEHTPYIKEERERIKHYGGTVCSNDQLDGNEPLHEAWKEGDGKPPPRVWGPGCDVAGAEKQPGCAFTRSIGDSVGAALGVIATPSLKGHTLTKKDRVLMVMSDGISDFIPDLEAAEIARLYTNPLEACRALVGKSYEYWVGTEDRSDDISIILLFIEPPETDPLRSRLGRPYVRRRRSSKMLKGLIGKLDEASEARRVIETKFPLAAKHMKPLEDMVEHTQKEMLQQSLDDLRKLEEPSELMEESAPDEASIMRAQKAIEERMVQGLRNKAVALECESADRSGPHEVTKGSNEGPSEEGISETQTPLRLPRRDLRHLRPQTAEIVVEVQPETSLDLSAHRPYRVGILRKTRTLDTCTALESISISAKLFAVTMSFLSGFLGGLCGIRGPPIMLFFLHAGHFGLVFTKASQRATGAAITFCNVAMRVLFYVITSADGSSSRFDGDDYPMYISIAFCSFAGVWLGQNLFERMKDSQATIKAFSPNPDPVFRPLTLTLALTVTLSLYNPYLCRRRSRCSSLGSSCSLASRSSSAASATSTDNEAVQ